jgi:hypothetical protein
MVDDIRLGIVRNKYTAALVPSEYNRSESCVRLESPPNGDLNCLSWTWGQMCRPSCSMGHIFFRPLPSAVYLCGRDRRWKPGTSVPDCARKLIFTTNNNNIYLNALDRGVEGANKLYTTTTTDAVYILFPFLAPVFLNITRGLNPVDVESYSPAPGWLSFVWLLRYYVATSC